MGSSWSWLQDRSAHLTLWHPCHPPAQTRAIDRSKKEAVQEANMYFLTESCLALFISFLINLFVMAVFGEAFYRQRNQDVVSVTLYLQGGIGCAS